MIAKPMQDTPENLLALVGGMLKHLNLVSQTEYPGMALRTSYGLHRDLLKAGQALAEAERILENVVSSK